jgi:hypothetical protein
MKLSRRGKLALAGTCLIASALTWNACGKKKSKDSSETSSGMTAAYPLGLSISVAPQSSSTTLADETDRERPLKEKKEEAESMLRGRAETCMPKAIRVQRRPNNDETCYEFDQDMAVGTRPGGRTLGTADGLAKKTGNTSEACMVSFAREEAKQVSAIVDETLGMIQMMLCQANKAGQGLPANDGDVLDFKPNMEAAAAAGGKTMPLTKAQMTKSGSNYVSEVTAQFPLPGKTELATRTMKLTHNPNGDNSSYKGVLNITMDKTFGNNADYNQVMSIQYAKVDGKVVYELRMANVETTSIGNAFDTNGVVNFGPATDNKMNAYKYVAFDMNPDSGEGNMSYWHNPGSGMGEAARGFVFNITADSAGLLKGCASSGAIKDTSIRKALQNSLAMTPNGFFHPFQKSGTPGYFGLIKPPVDAADDGIAQIWTGTNTGTVDNQGSIIARQCFKQASTGVYGIDGGSMAREGTAGYELIDFGGPADRKALLPTPPDVARAKQ